MSFYDPYEFHFYDNRKCLNDKVIQECYNRKFVGIKEMLHDNFVIFLLQNDNKHLNNKLTQECYIEKLVKIKGIIHDNLMDYLFNDNIKLINGKM
jgi:hypothetical protein